MFLKVKQQRRDLLDLGKHLKKKRNKKKSYPSRGIIFVFTERPGKMGENSGGKEFKEDENLPLQRLLKLFLNQAAVSDRAM